MQIIEEVEEPTLDTQLTSDNSGHLEDTESQIPWILKSLVSMGSVYASSCSDEYGDNRGERVVTVITSDAAALYGKVQHFKMANARTLATEVAPCSKCAFLEREGYLGCLTACLSR
eukprot:6476352-Amphidinium_carterae.2